MPVPIGRCIKPRYVPMGAPRRDESREYCILWNDAAVPFWADQRGGYWSDAIIAGGEGPFYDPDGLETRKVLRRA